MPRVTAESASRATRPQCVACGRTEGVSAIVGACVDCLRAGDAQATARAAAGHAAVRKEDKLPAEPPRADPEAGPAERCHLCMHACKMAPEEVSFCGLRQGGRLRGRPQPADDSPERRGSVSWYADPLPTNCVADWVCPGGTGAGYPQYAVCDGPERGYYNLAVFLHGCTFDCLFCQNWHHRRAAPRGPWRTAAELAAAVTPRTSCLCFFGGDPSAQMPFALEASRLALEANQGRVLRICWETNGASSPSMLRAAAELSLQSGGCVKVDLKAWSEDVHRALSGVTNQHTLHNFAWLAQITRSRPQPPLLVASTPIVAGYVDAAEVSGLARFIAQLDPTIPYSLLATSPAFAMHDIPPTPSQQMQACYQAALEAGLERVRVGNVHLLDAILW